MEAITRGKCPLHFDEKNLKMAALFSAGFLFGTSFGLNYYSIPILKELREPEERKAEFTKLYEKGKQMAIASTLVLTGSLAALYCKTKDKGLFCPISLSLLKFPVTLFFMKNQINDELFNYEGDDNKKLDDLTDSWKSWHWFRVSLDACAFVAVICTVIYKKNQN